MESASSRTVEQRLRAAVESAPSGLLMTDPAGKIVLVNREVERLFGYSREELVGKRVELLVPDRFHSAHPEFRGEFYRDPRVRAMGAGRDLFGRRRDGTEVPVEIGLNPIATEEGLFVIASVVDIRARRQAEIRFRAAVEASPNGMVMIDDTGTIVLVNREIERLFRYDRDELLGRPVEILVPERFRTGHPAFREGFLRDPQARPMGAGRDLFGLRKDGSELRVEIGLNPLETEEGMLVIASIVDIEARHAAEEALRRSEERFRLLLEGVRDYAIVMLDPTGRIESWNEGAQGITGWRAEEILGRSVVLLYPEQDVEQLKRELAVARGRERFEEEGWRIRKGGERFLASVVVTALRDHGGSLRGFAKVMRDITDQRLLEERVRQSQKMEAIGTLAGGIAHDFNNILAAIIGYAELAEDGVAGDPQTQADLQSLLRSAERGKHLVGRILAFSRRQEVQRVPLDLTEQLTDGIKLLRATLPSTIDIRSHVGEAPVRVLADPTSFHQVLMNLATNRAHAMSRGGTLEIGLSRTYLADHRVRVHSGLHEGWYAEFRVRDTGHGMDPETLDRAVEPFFTTRASAGGTGLGLAVVHAIVREHEGALELESEPGRGTVVRCFLPLCEAEEPAPGAVDVQSPLAGGGEGILLVDDEPDLVKLGERRLSALGYRVSGHMDAAAALEAFRAAPSAFDLVITDLTMPRVTGLDLAAEVRRLRPEVPVLMLTGYLEELTPETLETSGITRVMRKPVAAADLSRAVRELVERGRPRRRPPA